MPEHEVGRVGRGRFSSLLLPEPIQGPTTTPMQKSGLSSFLINLRKIRIGIENLFHLHALRHNILHGEMLVYRVIHLPSDSGPEIMLLLLFTHMRHNIQRGKCLHLPHFSPPTQSFLINFEQNIPRGEMLTS